MKIFRKIIQGLGIVLLLAVLFLLTVKVNGYIQLKDFYDYSKKEFMIPGLFEGFVPQGMDYDEGKNAFIISGYHSDGNKSMIYVVNSDKTVKKLYLKNSKGIDCIDHLGGVTIYKDYLLLSGGNGASTEEQYIFTLKLEDIYQKEEEDYVTSLRESPVYVGTAFVNAVGDTLYVGEYNNDESSIYNVRKTTNRTWMPDDCKAIMLEYNLNPDGTIGMSPIKAYAIPDNVQGMTFVDEGMVAFSESYGINPSWIEVFEMPSISEKEVVLDGIHIPLYYFKEELLNNKIKTSPMLEAIVYYNGRIYTLNESSSKRYIFGIAFRGSYVYSYEYNHK